MRTPSMVSEVSAIEVASTTLRRPVGAGAMARSCTAASSAPNSGNDFDRGVGDALASRVLGAADFRRARQERQHRAGIGAQRPRDRVRHLPLDRLRRHRGRDSGSRPERRGLRSRSPGASPSSLGDPRAVERRRHHQDAQILAQALLGVARQRKAEIGIERALVEFVEQHRGDAVESRDRRGSGR